MTMSRSLKLRVNENESQSVVEREDQGDVEEDQKLDIG